MDAEQEKINEIIASIRENISVIMRSLDRVEDHMDRIDKILRELREQLAHVR